MANVIAPKNILPGTQDRGAYERAIEATTPPTGYKRIRATSQGIIDNILIQKNDIIEIPNTVGTPTGWTVEATN